MKRNNKKLTLSQSLERYYSNNIQQGELEQVAQDHIELCKVFPSYIAGKAVADHWSRALRKITGKDIYITFSYDDVLTGKKKHSTEHYKTQKSFIQSLRAMR